MDEAAPLAKTRRAAFGVAALNSVSSLSAAAFAVALSTMEGADYGSTPGAGGLANAAGGQSAQN